MKIKKGDTVQIITGKDKGKSGRIIKVHTEKQRVVVEGLNMVSKHQRPTQENPQGGIVQTEASIHHSNVMLVDKNKITSATIERNILLFISKLLKLLKFNLFKFFSNSLLMNLLNFLKKPAMDFRLLILSSNLINHYFK